SWVAADFVAASDSSASICERSAAICRRSSALVASRSCTLRTSAWYRATWFDGVSSCVLIWPARTKPVARATSASRERLARLRRVIACNFPAGSYYRTREDGGGDARVCLPDGAAAVRCRRRRDRPFGRRAARL